MPLYEDTLRELAQTRGEEVTAAHHKATRVKYAHLCLHCLRIFDSPEPGLPGELDADVCPDCLKAGHVGFGADVEQCPVCLTDHHYIPPQVAPTLSGPRPGGLPDADSALLLGAQALKQQPSLVGHAISWFAAGLVWGMIVTIAIATLVVALR